MCRITLYMYGDIVVAPDPRGGGATWFQLYPDVCVEK